MAVLLSASAALAEPMVVGYERFHQEQPSVEGGRLLFNELGCANCHVHDTGLPARRGPAIEGITSRINASWLREFLRTPSRARSGSTMPHLFDERDSEEIEAVIHYLGSLSSSDQKPPSSGRHVDADRGGGLYHTVGCMACHDPEPAHRSEEAGKNRTGAGAGSVSFPDISKKHSLNGLAGFLKNPLKHRPDGRMPRIELAAQDAVDLAGYLFRFPGSDPRNASEIEPFTADLSLAERGRKIVVEKRCAACHEIPGSAQVDPIKMPIGSGGCLDASPADGLPRYDLSRQQNKSLRMYLAESGKAVDESTIATLTLESLNCLACHEREGIGGPDLERMEYFVGDPDLGDSGRFPPPLSGIGDKLQPEWFKEVMSGKHRVRPYLKTRMPIYGNSTDSLHELLARVDDHEGAPLPHGDASAGQILLGTVGGNSCITCHSWNGRPSLGIPALDIGNISKRLQPDWLYRYLVDPGSYRPNTLMPSFWPDGSAANREVLTGDTKAQIASIIAFAKLDDGEPLGFPNTDNAEFELIPTDRPIVQRTFMEAVGTHAVLVGYPEGIHIAYDGMNARPMMAWKGRFFDAYSTWFSRFAPFEKPLGESIVRWEKEVDDVRDVRFLGYQLDPAGAPTFLYSLDGVRVEETLYPTSPRELVRELTWDRDQLKEIPIAHPTGAKVKESPDSKLGHLKFGYTWK